MFNERTIEAVRGVFLGLLDRISEILGIGNRELVAMALAALGLAGSILLKSSIKNSLIIVDRKLYKLGKNSGPVTRCLLSGTRFILPSDPLQGYVDHRTAVSLENDNIIDLSEVTEMDQINDPAKDWRLGFSLESVMSGLAVERSDSNDAPITQNLVSRLENKDGQVVVGPPGSGKSTICKQVACKWYRQGLGPVLYRESGHGPVTNKAALRQSIEETPPDKDLLIVIEDVCNPEQLELLDLLIEYRGENIRFLFDSKETELESLLNSQTFDTIRSKQAAVALISEFDRYSVPPINLEECRYIINNYKHTTGHTVPGSINSVYNRIENKEGVGQMLMLGYELTVDSSNIGNESLSGLEIDVRNKYSSISEPKERNASSRLNQYDLTLIYEVCFSINLWNVAQIPITEELIISLGKHDEEKKEIRRMLNSLEGWLIFREGSEDVFETYHELWSVYYLRCVIEDRRMDIQGLSLKAVNSITATFNREQDEGVIYPLLIYIYQASQVWPAISELLISIPVDELEVPEEFRPELDAELAAERSVALLNTGRYDEAVAELEEYYEIASNVDNIDQTELEVFYGSSLGRIYLERGEYIKAENHLRQLVAKTEDNDLNKAYLLNLFGAVLPQRGRFQESVECLKEAVEISRNHNDCSLEQNCMLNLGIVYEKGNSYEEARTYYSKAAAIAEEVGSNTSIARSNHNLGQILFTISQTEDQEDLLCESKNKLEYSYRIKKETGDIVGQAKSLGVLSNIYRELDKHDIAKNYLEEAESIAIQHNHVGILAEIYHNKGVALREQGDIHGAKISLLMSLSVQNKTGDVIEKFRSLDMLVSIYLIEGDLEAAVETAVEGLEMCIKYGDIRTSTDIIQFLISTAEITNNTEKRIGIVIQALKGMFACQSISQKMKAMNKS